jgi:hypothetical protein
MTSDRPQPLPARYWPKQWMQDESFWRDITTKAAATLLATGVGGLLGLAGLGLLYGWRAGLWPLVPVVLAAVGGTWAIRRLIKRQVEREYRRAGRHSIPPYQRSAVRTVLPLAMAVLAGLMLVIIVVQPN